MEKFFDPKKEKQAVEFSASLPDVSIELTTAELLASGHMLMIIAKEFGQSAFQCEAELKACEAYWDFLRGIVDKALPKEEQPIEEALDFLRKNGKTHTYTLPATRCVYTAGFWKKFSDHRFDTIAKEINVVGKKFIDAGKKIADQIVQKVGISEKDVVGFTMPTTDTLQ